MLHHIPGAVRFALPDEAPDFLGHLRCPVLGNHGPGRRFRWFHGRSPLPAPARRPLEKGLVSTLAKVGHLKPAGETMGRTIPRWHAHSGSLRGPTNHKEHSHLPEVCTSAFETGCLVCVGLGNPGSVAPSKSNQSSLAGAIVPMCQVLLEFMISHRSTSTVTYYIYQRWYSLTGRVTLRTRCKPRRHPSFVRE